MVAIAGGSIHNKASFTDTYHFGQDNNIPTDIKESPLPVQGKIADKKDSVISSNGRDLDLKTNAPLLSAILAHIQNGGLNQNSAGSIKVSEPKYINSYDTESGLCILTNAQFISADQFKEIFMSSVGELSLDDFGELLESHVNESKKLTDEIILSVREAIDSIFEEAAIAGIQLSGEAENGRFVSNTTEYSREDKLFLGKINAQLDSYEQKFEQLATESQSKLFDVMKSYQGAVSDNNAVIMELLWKAQEISNQNYDKMQNTIIQLRFSANQAFSASIIAGAKDGMKGVIKNAIFGMSLTTIGVGAQLKGMRMKTQSLKTNSVEFNKKSDVLAQKNKLVDNSGIDTTDNSIIKNQALSQPSRELDNLKVGTKLVKIKAEKLDLAGRTITSASTPLGSLSKLPDTLNEAQQNAHGKNSENSAQVFAAMEGNLNKSQQRATEMNNAVLQALNKQTDENSNTTSEMIRNLKI